jgi:putative transposase
MRDAYCADDGSRARRLFTNLVRRIRDEHPGAADSLEEGLDETLTVKRLGLSSKLERQRLDDERDRESDGCCPPTHAPSKAPAQWPDDPPLDGDRCR